MEEEWGRSWENGGKEGRRGVAPFKLFFFGGNNGGFVRFHKRVLGQQI